MKLLIRIGLVVLVINLLLMCNKTGGGNSGETILKGSTTVVVDETLYPIIEDEKLVFESQYDAKIDLVKKSETEAVRDLLQDSTKIIILGRNLTDEEQKFFHSAKRFPKVTPFATDAVALIANASRKDSTVTLKSVIEFMKTGKAPGVEGLVFDNPNSGTVALLNGLAGLSVTPEKGVYSMHNSGEVVTFVSENPNMIGIIGINWVMQPPAELQSSLKNIQVLHVQGLDSEGFYAPTQNNLAEGTYPLARRLYFVNAQGYDGLGMGFASFIAGERGQRIILQSGLLPEHVPSRKIVTRKTL